MVLGRETGGGQGDARAGLCGGLVLYMNRRMNETRKRMTEFKQKQEILLLE